ncbi:hypothetical protein PR048_020450 [Dryococelus australis]|uniref:Uncharacterized protein n=1 Tax=Dryococelus australis TaxID=614101 RepID=A0ABQ9H6Q2_9NEOP|nr:hypothetical protein PR048_020450 [Dryococelus australis]
MSVKLGEFAAAAEYARAGKAQRHRPGRLPRAKIRERTHRELNPVRLDGRQDAFTLVSVPGGIRTIKLDSERPPEASSELSNRTTNLNFPQSESNQTSPLPLCQPSGIRDHSPCGKTVQPGVLRQLSSGRLISLCGDIPWPSRSPDLTSAIYFLCLNGPAYQAVDAIFSENILFRQKVESYLDDYHMQFVTRHYLRSIHECCVCSKKKWRSPLYYTTGKRSPPTKANRVQSPAGSPDFRKWESCRAVPLVGGFSRGSSFPPPLNSSTSSYSLHSPSSALKTSLRISDSIPDRRLGSVTPSLKSGADQSPIWEALDIEALRADDCEASAGMQGREKLPISGIVQHDSHVRKPGATPPGFESATVAERLGRSPPTKVNRAQSPAGPPPDFRKWESRRTMPLVGGSSRLTPVPPALAFGAASFSPR